MCSNRPRDPHYAELEEFIKNIGGTFYKTSGSHANINDMFSSRNFCEIGVKGDDSVYF